MPTLNPNLTLLESPAWKDYALLDSGDGLKLERFGPYTFVRPEVQAMWSRTLPQKDWDAAHAVFQPTSEESGGHWQIRRKLPEEWVMHYGSLAFHAQTTPGRHLGVFPECAAHWDWAAGLIAGRPLNVLNLFGYTGLASLAAAAAGARVAHVDASKKSIGWARGNQSLSGLEDKPIRWLLDDAVKFVQREARRGGKYEGILLDPPKFGRGPKGEVWEVYKSLPSLLQDCRAILNDKPLFVIVTVYAVRAPAIHIGQALAEMMSGLGGTIDCGELVTREQSAGRLLSQAVYARWSGD
jgi:23S rRNA (cytosine1962-C5)-methyltransferase